MTLARRAPANRCPRNPTRLHDRHAPPQAVLQQTPWPLTSPRSGRTRIRRLSVQTAPFIFLPQLPFTHLRPLTQSASLVHGRNTGWWRRCTRRGRTRSKRPTCSRRRRRRCRFPITASASQVPALQTVPTRSCGICRCRRRCRRGRRSTCLGRDTGWPRAASRPRGWLCICPETSARPQDWQVPSQAVSQQNPSAQKPLEHWLLQPQASPFEQLAAGVWRDRSAGVRVGRWPCLWDRPRCPARATSLLTTRERRYRPATPPPPADRDASATRGYLLNKRQ